MAPFINQTKRLPQSKPCLIQVLCTRAIARAQETSLQQIPLYYLASAAKRIEGLKEKLGQKREKGFGVFQSFEQKT